MKITKSKLTEIIREELKEAMAPPLRSGDESPTVYYPDDPAEEPKKSGSKSGISTEWALKTLGLESPPASLVELDKALEAVRARTKDESRLEDIFKAEWHLGWNLLGEE